MEIERTSNKRINGKIIASGDFNSYSTNKEKCLMVISHWDGKYTTSIKISKEEILTIIEMASKGGLIL
jgi:hypothetical protein